MAMRQKPSARYLISNKATAAVENNAREKNKTHMPPCHRFPSPPHRPGGLKCNQRADPTTTAPEKNVAVCNCEWVFAVRSSDLN